MKAQDNLVLLLFIILFSYFITICHYVIEKIDPGLRQGHPFQHNLLRTAGILPRSIYPQYPK